MNYTVVEGSGIIGLTGLITQVKQLINDGWKPLGGICAIYSDSYRYYQAMVREVQPDTDKKES